VELRPNPARVRVVYFGVLFVVAAVAWCAALLLARGHVAYTLPSFGIGFALADVLGCLGTLAAERLDRARDARLLRLVTTPQEFAALPMPDYLLPVAPPLYEPEVTLSTPQTAAAPQLIPAYSAFP
jgi:hypothetical protein